MPCVDQRVGYGVLLTVNFGRSILSTGRSIFLFSSLLLPADPLRPFDIFWFTFEHVGTFLGVSNECR